MEISSHEMEKRLWTLFVFKNDEFARSQLIHKHMPLAKYHASRLYKNRFDDDVEFDDYLQYANVGLIEAIDNYDISRDVAFSSYAAYRIKGAILSGITRFTEKREQLTLRKRLQNERVKSISSNANSTFFDMVETTLGLAISFILSDTALVQTTEDVGENQPYYQENISRLNKEIRSMLQLLSKSENIVIVKHYFEHKRFVEISTSLNVSKGRVSQIHKNAIMKLRTYISENHIDDIL